jgi:SOS-response transcriptional repressor LexA
MNTWTIRAKRRMKELKITHLEMSQHLGISRPSITHYLSGRREPSLKQLIEWAAILKTAPEWLQFGVETPGTTTLQGTNFKPAPPVSSYLPVISWAQAIQWKTLAKKYQPSKQAEWIPYAGDPIPDAFALQVRGDSMEALSGTSFPEHSFIIVAPQRIAQHEDFVIVRIKNEEEAILRQFIIEGKQQLLKALNPRYPIIEMKGGITLCGVVCQTLQRF